MNPYNADEDYKRFVAWEEGYVAALEAVLSEDAIRAASYRIDWKLVPANTTLTDAPFVAARNAVQGAVSVATIENDKEAA